MRKLFIALGIAVGLLVVIALAAPALIDVNRYHGQIQSKLEQQLQRPVSLGRMHLSLIPPAVRVDDVSVGEDPRFATGRAFATAGALFVRPKLLPLLHSEVAIYSLELQRPQIELVKDQRGTWNFASLGTQPGQPQPAQPNAGNGGRSFSLGRLTISDGQVAITDWQKRQPRAVYDHIDLDLANLAPGKSMSVDLRAHLPGAGAELVRLSGDAGPLADVPLKTPLSAKLLLDHVEIAALSKFVNLPALRGTDGVLSGDARVENAQGKLAIDGTLRLENGRMRGVDIGYPISADVKLADDLNADLLTIDRGDLKLGNTPVSITGRLNLQPTPAQLDAQVKASGASLTDAARLAAALGVAFNAGTRVAGVVDANIHAQGAANNPALNGTLAARNLVVSGRDVPSEVRVPAIQLSLTPQMIRSNPFTATSGGTALNSSFALSNYTTPARSIQASLATNNANLAELLSIAKAYGVSAAEGMAGSGTLSANLQVSGPTANLNGLNFAGSGNLRSASLKLPSLTQPVQVRNANLRFTQNSMGLDQVAIALGHTNASGNMTVRNFAAPQLQFALNADRIDAAEWQQIMGGTAQKTGSAEAPTAGQGSSIANVSGGGTLNIGTLTYDQMVMTNAQANVTFSKGVVTLAPVVAQLFGGQENGQIVIDTRVTPPRVAMTSNLQRVDANKLLSSVSSLKNVLYGTLASNAHASFSSSGSTDIARSLNGSLGLDLRNGKLANIDMLQQLASVGKFLNSGQPAKPFTDLVQLTGNFDVKNGLATTNNLKAVIDGGTLAAAGTANLADQSLNMRVTAVLNKAMSTKVGGTQVGGLMNTALANDQGELVMPVLLTGTFQSPHFAPDVERVAQMKLNHLLPTSGNPGQLTSGLLGGLLGNKAGNPAAGGLQGILGRVTGQDQTQQPAQTPAQQAPPPNGAQTTPPKKKGAAGLLDSINGALQQQQQKQDQQQPPPQPAPPKP